MGLEAINNRSQYSNIYQNQNQFNQYFSSTFDKYDRNHDGKLDRNEFQPLINDMCNQVQQQYGSGPTLDKIRQAWMTLDKDNSGYITRAEFSTKARAEVERILNSPSQPGYNQPGYGQPGYGQPGYQQGQEPVYKQISVGQGIDQNEFTRIVDCCKGAYIQMRGASQTAQRAAEGIKQMLGGDWLVFISNVGYENFDFSLTRVKGGDFMAFSLDNKKFQVCRLK
jgi:hypothetical protein